MKPNTAPDYVEEAPQECVCTNPRATLQRYTPSLPCHGCSIRCATGCSFHRYRWCRRCRPDAPVTQADKERRKTGDMGPMATLLMIFMGATGIALAFSTIILFWWVFLIAAIVGFVFGAGRMAAHNVQQTGKLRP